MISRLFSNVFKMDVILACARGADASGVPCRRHRRATGVADLLQRRRALEVARPDALPRRALNLLVYEAVHLAVGRGQAGVSGDRAASGTARDELELLQLVRLLFLLLCVDPVFRDTVDLEHRGFVLWAQREAVVTPRAGAAPTTRASASARTVFSSGCSPVISSSLVIPNRSFSVSLSMPCRPQARKRVTPATRHHTGAPDRTSGAASSARYTRWRSSSEGDSAAAILRPPR